MMIDKSVLELPTLKISTGWVNVSVTGEPTVKMSFRGYAPVLPVQVVETKLDYLLYISAKSLSAELEPLRDSNDGKFLGLQFSLRKSSSEQTSAYEVQSRSTSG